MKFILIVLCTFPFIFSEGAVAAQGFAVGKVKYIRMHDVTDTYWKPPVFWFVLEGTPSVGACPIWNGNVLFVAETEQAFSLLLAAQMAQMQVAVRWDDTGRKNTWCKAFNITTGDPPAAM